MYLFFLGYAGSLLLPGLLLLESGGYSGCSARVSNVVASFVVEHGASKHRLSEVWLMGLFALQHVELSGAGVQPMSPALAGEFCTPWSHCGSPESETVSRLKLASTLQPCGL